MDSFEQSNLLKIQSFIDKEIKTLSAEAQESKRLIREKGYEFMTMCAPIAEGTKDVVNAVWNKLQTLPPIKQFDSEEIPTDIIVEKADNKFTIDVQDDVYFVEAEWLLEILQRTDLDDYESLQYFQRVLRSSGIIDALLARGIQEGDTVCIYDLEFDFVL